MATKVIDALTVTLGLDHSDFMKGIGEVDRELGKSRTAVVKTSREMGTAISGAARQFALAFLGFSSGAGITRMLAGLNEASRQLGLLAQNTGQNVQDLKNYGNAFAVAGGSAESFMETISLLQQRQSAAQMTGVSGWEPFLRFLEVGIVETGDDGIVRARDKLEVLKEMANSFQRLSREKGQPFANSLGLQMGFNQEAMTVLLQGGAAIEKYVAQQEQLIQNSQRLADGAKAINEQWELMKTKIDSVKNALLEDIQPATEKFLKQLNQWIDSRTVVTGVKSIREQLKLIFSPGSAVSKETAKILDERPRGLEAIPGTAANNRNKYIGAIRAAEQKHGIPAELLERVANQESHWRSDIISGKTRSSEGAVGLMQLMPQFFPGAGKDPNADIETAAAYLKKLRGQFGNWEDAAAAYNAGPGTLNAVKSGRGGLPSETRQYVDSLFGAGAAQRVAAPVGTGTVLAPSGAGGNTTTVGTINIYPAPGTADSVRAEIGRAIERKGLVYQSDYGVRP